MIISLTGFMGSGKSSVGRRLSELLSCHFMDLDVVIEERSGRTIPEIFATDGETGFRKLEAETLNVILSETKDVSMILALGGGTVMTPECAEMVHSQTICLYLRATVDTLVSHLENKSDGRPMLSSAGSSENATELRTRIEGLMQRRSATYEKIAHIIIDTDDRSIEAIASEIADVLQNTQL